MKRWLLLDRDDTIIDDPGYLSDPDGLSFLPGAVEGLREFSRAGWPLVVVSNQSGIGRGYFEEAELALVHDRLRQRLAEGGIELTAIYYCPHTPDDNCACRKPKPELGIRAAVDLGLELKDAVMVGDKESDLEMGRALGVAFVAQITAKRPPSPLADGTYKSLLDLWRELKP